MQCFNCGFHNMPGSRGCARCGANFALATAAIDVQPPRASGWRKSLSGATAAVTRLLARGRLPRLAEPSIRALDLPAAFMAPFLAIVSNPTLLVPGLPQMLAGGWLPGGSICLAWVLLMIAGISCVSTVLGGLLLALALVLHAFSAALATRVIVDSFLLRYARNVGFGLALLMICYLPAAWLVSRRVFPIGMYASRPPLAAGDVLWCRRSGPPRAGEIWYSAANMAFVRVRAVAGQQVTWRDGLLLVDGVPSPWQPADWAFPDGTSDTLGSGEALVFDVPFQPPDAEVTARRLYNDPWINDPRSASLRRLRFIVRLSVPQSSRLVFRSYPWHRVGRVD